jgi:glutamate-1-semialdehyde 2,1-aminomutase
VGGGDAAVIRRASAALPGASLGSFRLPDDLAFAVARGEAGCIWSTSGSRSVDWVMSCGALPLGHAHPEVVAAIEAQARRGASFYQLNEQAIELAEALVRIVPCAEMVKLCGSGSEAMFYALRIARAATGRDVVLKFAGSYLGAHDYGLHDLDQDGAVQTQSAGIPAGVTRDVLVAPFNDLKVAARLVREHGRRLAAIAVEPVQRAIEPAPGFLEGLRDLCDQSGAILVFDEVVTGSRLALGGAQEHYGVLPDLCALGKGLGGGLPLGAVAGRADLLELTAPRAIDTPTPNASTGAAPGPVYMSGSLNGNPLSCAAALATLRVLERDGGVVHLASVGRALRRGLESVAAELGVPLRMIGPDAFPEPVIGLGSATVTDLASYERRDQAASVAFGLELIRRGVFVFPGFKLYPATTHSNDDVDETIMAARGALTAIAG